jgi:hypothetical protein
MSAKLRFSVLAAGVLIVVISGVRLLSFTAAPLDAVPQDALIFILAGQSNMSGRGRLEDMPALKTSDNLFVYSNAGKWQKAQEPIDDPRGQIDQVSADHKAGVSPGLAFAARLAELMPGREIALVPAAKGNTSFADWARNPSRNTLYGSMIARAKEAQQRGCLAGLLWYQGESDSNDAAATRAWPAWFERFVADVRTDLDAPDLPVVMTVLGPNTFPEKYSGWDGFVQMQQTMALPPNVIRVSANDLEGEPRGPHLVTKSYIELGRRYAEALAPVLTAAQSARASRCHAGR